MIFPRKTFDSFKNLLKMNYCHLPGICNEGGGGGGTDVAGGGVGGMGGINNYDQESSSSMEAWSAPMGQKSIFDDGAMISYDKSQLDQLPTLTIILSEGPRLTVEPDQYMAQQEDLDADGLPYYALAITTIKGFEKLYVLGESLLNHYYVEFDRTKHRLGFANAVANCTQAVTATQ